MNKRIILLITTFFLTVSSLSFAKSPSKIAVWDLEARDIPSPYARELTSVLVSELIKLGKFEVYSQENIRTVAGWTAERMKLGTTDTRTLTMLGEADVTKLISGSVAKIGDTYSVSINIFDTREAKIENSVSDFCNVESELIDLVKKIIRKLGGIIAVVGEKIPSSCEAPIWDVGDKWIYMNSKEEVRTIEVVKEGKDFYICAVKGLNRKVLLEYDKNTLNIKFMTEATGKKREYNFGNKKFLDFPLHVGKTWKIDYIGYAPLEKRFYKYIVEYKVENIEDVFAKVGTLKTYKISMVQLNQDLGTSGNILWWYSPKVKNYVKRRTIGSTRFYAQTEWEYGSDIVAYELK